MPQPNKGTHGTPPTAAPIIDKKAPGAKGGDVHFGHQPGGTRGSK